jgi:hypothetical protein
MRGHDVRASRLTPSVMRCITYMQGGDSHVRCDGRIRGRAIIFPGISTGIRALNPWPVDSNRGRKFHGAVALGEARDRRKRGSWQLLVTSGDLCKQAFHAGRREPGCHAKEKVRELSSIVDRCAACYARPCEHFVQRDPPQAVIDAINVMVSILPPLEFATQNGNRGHPARP